MSGRSRHEGVVGMGVPGLRSVTLPPMPELAGIKHFHFAVAWLLLSTVGTRVSTGENIGHAGEWSALGGNDVLAVHELGKAVDVSQRASVSRVSLQSLDQKIAVVGEEAMDARQTIRPTGPISSG